MKKKDFKIQIYIETLLAMFFWGLSFVWVKIVYRYYKPFTTVFFRLLFSGIILTLYDFIKKKYYKKKFYKNDKAKEIKIDHNKKPYSEKSILFKFQSFKYLLLLAFFEPFLYFMGESFGLQLVSASIGSIIIAMIPVITPLFSYLILKEKISINGIIGLIISFAGVLILTIGKDLHFKYSPKGILLMFFAVFSAIGYIITAKKISMKFEPLTIVKYQNLIASIYFLPFFLIFDFKNFLNVKPDFILIKNLIYLSLLPSTISFIFYNRAIRTLGVNKVNFISNTIPVFTAISSYFILHEKFSYDKIAGLIIILIGILISNFSKKRKDKAYIIEY